MNRMLLVISLLTLLFGLGLSACGSTAPPPNIEEAVAIAVEATIAAQPPAAAPVVETATPYPTYTAYPTYTPYPTPEAVSEAVTGVSAEPEAATAEPEPPPTSPPAEPTPTPVPAQAVETTIRPKDGAVMVFVPAGEFLMGASAADLSLVGAGGPPKLAGGDEQPQHPVTLEAYWIDQTEVTNAQFSNFANLTGYQTTAQVEGYGTSPGQEIEGANFFHPRGSETGIDDKLDHPVVQVSWHDATTYCEWAGARLPTEPEWEKAAKGPANDRVFPWGNAFQLPEFDVATVTNFCSSSCPVEAGRDPNVDDGFAYTAPVGRFPAGASPYGVLDMAGNVWEWVDGFYQGYPGTTYEQAGDFGESYRVVRGGSWDNAAQHLRTTFRQNNEPRLRSDGTGFRCAISAADFEPAPAEAEVPPTEEAAEPEAESAVEETPAEESPTEEAPAEEQAGETPAEETPVEEAPTEETQPGG
jgi:formylglycine-generating enzyme required for sulfatase activity